MDLSMDGGWCLMIVMLHALLITAQHTYPEIKEYCERDMFAPKCEKNEAILLTHAKYGRMRDGRCIGIISGTMGCSTDVKKIIDRKCSGRRECSIVVASLVPENEQPCPTDYRSYLEAAYECVPVAWAEKELCTGPLEIKAPSGYLSSRIADENGCGTLDSPWFVTVSPGQHIQFKLLDFGQADGTIITRKGQVCTVYAIIKEERLQASETICATGVRETQLYTSVGNMVEVRLVVRATDKLRQENNHFMLHYEAVGCPDMAPPARGWSRRDGDMLTVGCNDTNEQYHLRCDDKQWQGAWNNCTSTGAPALGVMQTQWGLFSQSHGVSIFVIVCIALGVGIIILTIGLVYLRRRSRMRRGVGRGVLEDPCGGYQGKVVQPAIGYSSSHHHQHKSSSSSSHADPMYTQQHGGISSSENDYYKTWQMQRHTGTGSAHHMQHLPPLHPPSKHCGLPLPPPPYSDGGSTGSGSMGGYNRSQHTVEHIYESPKFLRKAFDGGGGSGRDGGSSVDGAAINSPTEYYELDPDMHAST